MSAALHHPQQTSDPGLAAGLRSTGCCSSGNSPARQRQPGESQAARPAPLRRSQRQRGGSRRPSARDCLRATARRLPARGRSDDMSRTPLARLHPVRQVPGAALDVGLPRPDRLPARRSPTCMPLKRPGRSLAVESRAPPPATDRPLPGPARAHSALRVAGGQRDLVGAAAGAGGRADRRLGRSPGRLPVARRRLELRQAARGSRVVVPGDGHPGTRAACLSVRFGHPGALQAADRAAELLLSRRLLWRRRDGAVIRPDWGRPADRIQYPIQFYDVLFALRGHGRDGSPRRPALCRRARRSSKSKRLPDGGFPLEDRVGTTRSVVASRATFADWGPGGTTRSNPLVTVAALGVLRAAALGRLGVDPGSAPQADPRRRRRGLAR